MGPHQMPLENRHAQALRVGDVYDCTRPEHPGPSAMSLWVISASPETHSRLVSGFPWWDTSGAFAL
jgi:hypothetical protein